MHSLTTPSLVASAIDVIVGIALIGLRESLSRRLFPGDSTIALPAESDFVGALLAVLGVYFVVTAIADAASAEIMHRMQTTAGRGEVPDYLLNLTTPSHVIRYRIWRGVQRPEPHLPAMRCAHPEPTLLSRGSPRRFFDLPRVGCTLAAPCTVWDTANENAPVARGTDTT
jgi:hypothetical protein